MEVAGLVWRLQGGMEVAGAVWRLQGWYGGCGVVCRWLASCAASRSTSRERCAKGEASQRTLPPLRTWLGAVVRLKVRIGARGGVLGRGRVRVS